MRLPDTVNRDLRRRRFAMIAITVLFLGLVRCLGEFYRLKGPEATVASLEPYVFGAMLAALGCWLSVGLFFFNRFRLVVGAAGVTVGLMLAYKLIFMA